MRFVSFVPYICHFNHALESLNQPYEIGLLEQDRIYPLSAILHSHIPHIFTDMNVFIQSHTQDMLQSLHAFSVLNADKHHIASFALQDITLLAPIPRPRQDIICLGINYLEHARESAAYKNEPFDQKREEAVYFSKRVNVATPHNVPIPSHVNITQKLDYEVELGVIIGSYLYQPKNPQEALDSIFGYTIINDISARDIQQKHKQWYMGKSLEGSLPMGPCILHAQGIDPQNLAIKSYVNGEKRQDSHTSQMICTIAHALYELSHYCALQAGSIISMGTPSGVGMGFNPPKFLQSKDEILCEIEGIGVLRNTIA